MSDPNDGESLYHSMESADLTCARLLLAAGARVPGTNALRHALDSDRLDRLRLLLAHGADPNEPGALSPLHWAIRRGRSLAHVDALLAAGADPRAEGPGGVTPYRTALAFGAADIAARLRGMTQEPEPGAIEQFIAAAARTDLASARDWLAREPNVFAEMTPLQLRMLPELAALGRYEPVATMLELGWPVDRLGGDWNASALNLAVFNGDPPLTRLVLAHGARWDVRHGHDDNVHGTLSWASINEPEPGGDWLGCARALVEAGVPLPEGDYSFSPEITEYFRQVRAERESGP